MRKANLVRNTLFSGIANASSVLLLVLLVIAARYFGAADFGILTFAMALGAACAVVADFGLSEIAKRAIARDPGEAPRYFVNITLWKLALSAGVALAIVLLILLFRDDTPGRLVGFLIGFASLTKSFKTFNLVFFQSLERFELYALSQALHNVLMLSGGLAAIALGADIVQFSIVFLAAKLVDLAIGLSLLMRQLPRPVWTFDLGFVREVQRNAIPIGAYAVLVEVYWYIDTILLAVLASDVQVGLYNAGYKLYEALLIFPLILCQAVSPQLSRLFKSDAEQHRALTERVFKYMFIVALLVSGVGIVFAAPAIDLLFGADYAKAVAPLQVLLLGVLFVFMHFVLHTVLISIDQQHLLVRLAVAGLLLNTVANVALIPRYGTLGAAAATVLSEFVIFALGYTLLRRAHMRIGIVRVGWRPALALALVLGVFLSAGFAIRLEFIALVVPAYFAALLLLGALDQQERSQIGALLRRLRG